MMRLLITEPARVVADHDDVVSVRAEDASGGFGILSGHADLITALSPSVVWWRHADGRACWCAVRRGVLSVHAGREVAIATRQAQLGDDLAQLEQSVRARFRAEQDEERRARVAATKLHTAAIRQIIRALRPDGRGSAGEGAVNLAREAGEVEVRSTEGEGRHAQTVRALRPSPSTLHVLTSPAQRER